MGNHPIIACITVHTVQLLKHEESSFGFIYFSLSMVKGQRKIFKPYKNRPPCPVNAEIRAANIGGFHCHTIKNKDGNLLIQKV